MLRSTLVTLSAVILVSCVENEPDEVDNGPSVPAEDVIQALDKAVGSDSPKKIKKDEFVTKTLNQIVSTESRQILQVQGLTVTKKTVSEDEIRFRFIEEIIEYIDGEERKYIREHNQVIKLEQSTTPEEENVDEVDDPKKQNLMRTLAPVSAFKALTQKSSTGNKITYHNLKVTTGTEEPPKLVKEAEDCRGIENCKMNITSVQFDQVEHLGDGEFERIGFYFKTSQDVPFMARNLMECREFTLRIDFSEDEETPQERSVPVKQCYIVEDFRPGSSSE